MTKQKVHVSSADTILNSLPELLDKGWKVVHIVAESVAAAAAINDRTYPKEIEMHGKIVIILEKEFEEKD